MENLTFTVIDGGAKVTLDQLRAGKKIVIDFWHVKCTRCPAALEKLDTIAANNGDSDLVSTLVTSYQ